MKSFSVCSSQTIRTDPEHHIKNYQFRKDIANRGIQTDPCNLGTCKTEECSEHKNISAKSDDGSASLNREQEMQRRRNPSRSEDFEALRSELLQWRRREERKIIVTARNEEHRQEMKKITLKKEAHLLRKIEQLKNSATDKRKKDKMELMMEAMSQPKQWKVSNGPVIIVDTPETSRARELKIMYDAVHKKVDEGMKTG